MNKKGLAKIIIIVLVLIVIIAAIGYLVIFRKPNTGNAPTTSTTTIKVANIGPVACENDASCLSSNFLQCKPAEFKMDFTTPGSKYVITVFGEENGKCHYGFKVLNADGTIIAGVDCNIPMSSISEDTFKHFFGQDQGTAKETQAQLEATYCTALH